MDRYTEAYNTPAKKMSELKAGKYSIKCGRRQVTMHGPTYILLIGDDLQPYWCNEYMKKCMLGIDTVRYQDTEYLMNKNMTLASLEIADCTGKYSKSYKLKMDPTE